MNILALISLGLFSTLSWAVWTDKIDEFQGGSSKARTLSNMIDYSTQRFGVHETSILLFSFGVILAFLFLIRHSRHERLRALGYE
ncbi:MAG: hypothetical protein OXQ92_00240 [Boseongicola sp.]|nr:hypothetical protein [Boseongicola sp.]MDD9977687.1 hypothetical protein [Boseongicola sp.]